MNIHKLPRRIGDLILDPPKQAPFWINGGILPRGGVMILGGQAKLGKTFLLTSMIDSLVMGTPLFGVPEWSVPESCRVLMIDRELGDNIFWDRVAPCFEPYRHDEVLWQLFYDNAYFMTRDDYSRHINLSTSSGLEVLMDALDAVQPNVLILDPIGKSHGFDENDAGSMNKLFLTLEEIRSRHSERQLSIVFSHHFGKLSSSRDSGRRPLDPYNFRGSTRWYDDPDTILTARKRREHRISPEHKWWEVEANIECRAGIAPDPFTLHVNEANDRRVLFSSWNVRPEPSTPPES